MSLCVWVIKRESESFSFPTDSLPVVELNGFVKAAPVAPPVEAHFSGVYGRPPTSGEVGCYTAHQKAYEYLAKSDYAAMLVLEADAYKIRDLDIEALIYKLGRHYTSWILDLEPRTLSRIRYWTWPMGRQAVSRLALPDYGTTGYVISRAAAKSLLRLGNQMVWQADWPPHAGSEIAYFSCRKPVVGHRIGGSLIGRPSGGPSFSNLMSRIAYIATSAELANRRIIVFRSVILREAILHLLRKIPQ